MKNPTKEQIVALHEKYVQAVVDLYNKYKHKYSEFPETEIKIVWINITPPHTKLQSTATATLIMKLLSKVSYNTINPYYYY